MKKYLSLLGLSAAVTTSLVTGQVKSVPLNDPLVEATAGLEFESSLLGKHPRLLFTEESFEVIRQFSQTEEGKFFMEPLEGYLDHCVVDKDGPFQRDATDAQRQGFWRLPTVALHYLLTGDEASFEKAVGYLQFFLSLDHWELGTEEDAGMGAGNIMTGMALAYDWLYNDLEEDFREALAAKLWKHARLMYYKGHLSSGSGSAYWRSDPHNNHRWHRNSGFALCALATYEGRPEQQWLLNALHKELGFIAHWLPHDGTTHESPTYMSFGGPYLTLAFQASDHLLGTKYLEQEFFRNVGDFWIQSIQPGLENRFMFGDTSGGFSSYDQFLFKAAAVHHQPDLTEALKTIMRVNAEQYHFTWYGMLWCDPKPAFGSVNNMGYTSYFPDIGLVQIRDGWSSDDVGIYFKAGPFGGYRLNEYREKNDFVFINVAHDDPDANSLLISVGGELVAESDRYSKHKKSSNHNTILINGIGQTVEGKKEGMVWSQPSAGEVSMKEMAMITTWKDVGNLVITEGEASGSYPELRDEAGDLIRPALDGFRRTVCWVRDDYLLVLDAIEAPEEVTISWLMQGKTLEGAGSEYLLKGNAAEVPFQVFSDVKTASQIAVSTADERGKPLGWDQLQLESTTAHARFVSLYDPWKTGVVVNFKQTGPSSAEVRVTGPGIDDLWIWEKAVDSTTPSALKLQRLDGSVVTVGDKDRALME